MGYWHRWEYKGWFFSQDRGSPDAESGCAVWVRPGTQRQQILSLRHLAGARTLQQRRQLRLMLQQQIDLDEERVRLFGGSG